MGGIIYMADVAGAKALFILLFFLSQLQTWWRGVMVCKGLGPYSKGKKKKGKGKKGQKGKKGKKKKRR